MNKKYSCNECNYSTDRLSNLKNHNNSKKHLAQINSAKINQECPVMYENPTLDPLKCLYCKIEFKNIRNKSRHENICSLKIIEDLKIKYENKIKNIKYEHEKELEIEKIKNEFNNKLVESKQENLNDNRKAMKFERKLTKLELIQKQLSNNPPLVAIEDVTDIHEDFEDTDEFLKELIYHNKRNHLHKYIGEYIVKKYKKDDPRQQSIFTTDSSRLGFVYATKNKNGDDPAIIWQKDTNGNEVGDIMALPILIYIRSLITIYVKHINVSGSKGLDDLECRTTKWMEIRKIDNTIYDKTLMCKIMKFVCPQFNFVESTLLALTDK